MAENKSTVDYIEDARVSDVLQILGQKTSDKTRR